MIVVDLTPKRRELCIGIQTIATALAMATDLKIYSQPPTIDDGQLLN